MSKKIQFLILYLENTTPLSKRVVLFTGIYQSFLYRIFSAKQYMLRLIYWYEFKTVIQLLFEKTTKMSSILKG